MTQHIHSLNDLYEALSELSVQVDGDKQTETVEKAHAIMSFLTQLKSSGKDQPMLDGLLAPLFASIEQLVEQKPFADVMNAVTECYAGCDDPNCPYIHPRSA